MGEEVEGDEEEQSEEADIGKEEENEGEDNVGEEEEDDASEDEELLRNRLRTIRGLDNERTLWTNEREEEMIDVGDAEDAAGAEEARKSENKDC